MYQTPKKIFRPCTSNEEGTALPDLARSGFESLQRKTQTSHSQGSPAPSIQPSSSGASSVTYISIDDFPRNKNLDMPFFDHDREDDEIVEKSSNSTLMYHPSNDGGALSAWSLLAARFSSRCEFDEYK
jgi:hypothetical protein